MKIASFCFFLIHVMSIDRGLCQVIECQEYYSQFDFETPPKELVHAYESAPSPAGGMEYFYQQVFTKAKEQTESGKIFVQFIVDTLGNVQCLRIVKSDNESLNSTAIELIKQTEFIPAEQQGKKVISTMVLPITFGQDPPERKKKSRNRN